MFERRFGSGETEDAADDREVKSLPGFIKEVATEKAKGVIEKLRQKTDKIRGIDSPIGALTEGYLAGWDKVDFEFKATKGRIKQKIFECEKNNQEDYEIIAGKLGVTVDAYKEKMQARVEDSIEKSDFFVAVSPYVLSQVLKDGRFRTQFETHTSKGDLAPNYRAECEYDMFRIFKSFIARRPVYGFFSDNENGIVNDDGKIPPPTNTRQYGGIHVKLKKEKIIKRTTVLFGDSLIDKTGCKWPPTPASKPHYLSYPSHKHYSLDTVKDFLKDDSRTSVHWRYYGAQYHGGLSLEDVESIHISEDNSVSKESIDKARYGLEEYKREHPESDIKLVIY